MRMAHTLHDAPMKTQRSFDFYEESVKYTKLLEELKVASTLRDSTKWLKRRSV